MSPHASNAHRFGRKRAWPRRQITDTLHHRLVAAVCDPVIRPLAAAFGRPVPPVQPVRWGLPSAAAAG